jgi:hypothetical protein
MKIYCLICLAFLIGMGAEAMRRAGVWSAIASIIVAGIVLAAISMIIEDHLEGEK